MRQQFSSWACTAAKANTAAVLLLARTKTGSIIKSPACFSLKHKSVDKGNSNGWIHADRRPQTAGLALIFFLIPMAILFGCVSAADRGDQAARGGNWDAAIQAYQIAYAEEPTPALKSKLDNAIQQRVQQGLSTAQLAVRNENFDLAVTECLSEKLAGWYARWEKGFGRWMTELNRWMQNHENRI